jgi:hypothetical protein
MILCPNCLHKEMVGALFCSECGVQLVYSSGTPTGVIRQTTDGLRPPIAARAQSKPVAPPPPPALSNAVVSLNIISTGDLIPVAGQEEITLGRASEGQPIIPDIDLTAYKAYESGVSRMHASIRVADDLVTVTDLGSANGTTINGVKISAHIPQSLKHGDILTLGKFKIQILMRNAQGGG